VATLAIVPLSIWTGLTFFKVCGPLYRFKKYFEAIAAGNWKDSCQIRKADSLQDVNALINEAVRALRAKIEEQDVLLARARSLLVESARDHDDVSALLDSVDDARSDTALKCGFEKTTSTADSEAAGVAQPVESTP
jgi:hypothetical protein